MNESQRDDDLEPNNDPLNDQDDASEQDDGRFGLPSEMSLTLNVIPFKLKGRDGRVTEYEMREMDGTERDAYLNSVKKRMKGQNGVTDFDGLHAKLLSMCVYKMPNGTRLAVAQIQTWPSSVQMKLFKSAQQMNGLREDEATKNE